ncbi:translation inhibitor endoribonuclease [Rhodotorula toruloides NP11]|nr:translation inhibitor endoribonuclease [Rhodotorula toruloides NP11]EMS22849.1 translation inhibitor endoribonuclease [Rhodotorula toruloides NP11]
MLRRLILCSSPLRVARSSRSMPPVDRARQLAHHLSTSAPLAFSPSQSPKSKMPFEVVSTSNAPSAVGPYSQAIKTDSLVFVSGCVPLVPETMKVVEGGIEEQTEQAFKNFQAVVEASGCKLTDVVKTTVFLQSLGDFAKVNAIYSRIFGEHKPARSCVEVAKLPLGVLFEIEGIAQLPK